MRLRALDGVRGLAALVVLLHHALLTVPAFTRPFYGEEYDGPGAWAMYSPVHLGWAGEEAVLVFFVLSGVVVTLPFLREPPTMTWRGYYPSRLARLYLPVAASVVLALLWFFLVPRDATVLDPRWIQDHDTQVTVVTAGMTTVLLFGTSMFNSPLWSLRWEVWFSLLLPVYVLVARWRRGRVVVAVLLVAGLVLLPVGGAFYLLTFGVGVAIAVVLPRLRERRIGTAAGGVMLVGGVVALTWRWTCTGLGLDALAGHWRAAATFGAVLVIVLAIAWRPSSLVLESRVVQWLGLVSFSLYLTHEPIVVSLAHLVPQGLPWVTPVLSVVVCLPAAWLFHRLVEAPSHRFSRYLRARAEGTSSRRAAPAL